MSGSEAQVWERLTALAECALAEPCVPPRVVLKPMELTAAREVCREITASNSRTFYLASTFLPAEKRLAIRSLYAFCRRTDDIVDLAQEDPHGELLRWEQRATAEAPDYADPVLLAWHDIRVHYEIPSLFAKQLTAAVASDLAPARYATWAQLADYCYGVASTVGLMSMCIIGYNGRQAIPYAVKLGVALQLTNILRDVGEDWARGRLYIPQEDLDNFGVCEADWPIDSVYNNWRELMRFQIARNRRLYEEAWPGIALLHRDGQFAVAAACRLYAGILDDIERHDFQVFRRRAHLSGWEKLRQLPRIWWSSRALKAAPNAPAPVSEGSS